MITKAEVLFQDATRNASENLLKILESELLYIRQTLRYPNLVTAAVWNTLTSRKDSLVVLRHLLVSSTYTGKVQYGEQG